MTVGTFDGVHRGHQAVLHEIATRAQRSGRRSVLVTFEPHPLEVVNPRAAPQRLTLADERKEILAQSPLDLVVILPFTPALSQYTPGQFVELLQKRYHLRELVIGHDHGFGKGRAGDAAVIQRLGAERGFAVDVVSEVDVGSRSVSSTLVRRAVAGGDLDTARELLGRPYAMLGRVVPGAGRGRNIGYRTINVPVPSPRKLLPPDGVYAAWVEWPGGAAGGMMHQGPRPTFGEADRSVEIHLFDQDPDLYGVEVKVSWIERLRDVVAFADVAALKSQLDKDFRRARDALTRSGVSATY